MINLKQPSEPYRIEVIKGVSFTVKPLSTLSYTCATIKAQKQVSDLEKSIADVKMAGLAPEIDFDPKDQMRRNALYMEFLIKGLACDHIIAWEGVGDEADYPAECTPDNILAVMEQSAVAESFFQLFTNYVLLIGEARGRIRKLAAWHFRKNGGPSYCDTCKQQDLPCAFENLCPYQKYAPKLIQEQQAWQIIEACITQLNISPAGKIIGLKMDTALDMARARGFDIEIVSELLIEAERGILEALEDTNATPSPDQD